MNKRFLSAALFVVLLGCLCGRAQSVENAAVEREEYAVYSATISAIYVNDMSRLVVIANPTCCAETPKSKDEIRFPYVATSPISQDTFVDYLERNKTNRWLERRLESKIDYVIVDTLEIGKLASIDPRDDWSRLYNKYPGSVGFIHLSRVGFNNRKDQALVFTGSRCRGLCGQTQFVVLEKKGGRWEVIHRTVWTVS